MLPDRPVACSMSVPVRNCLNSGCVTEEETDAKPRHVQYSNQHCGPTTTVSVRCHVYAVYALLTILYCKHMGQYFHKNVVVPRIQRNIVVCQPESHHTCTALYRTP